MPIKAETRRDPQKGKKEFSANKGFTLIELMIAVGVLAIIASLALPSYRAIIEKRQVTSSAEQFAAFFSTVKSVAVKRNDDIAMYPTPRPVSGDERCLGFKEFDDNATYVEQKCDCKLTDVSNANACRVDLNNDGAWQANELTVLRSTDLRKPEVITGIEFFDKDGGDADTEFFIFDSVRGFIDVQVDNAASLTMSFESGDFALDVRIDRLGRTYMCSPQTATFPVPGYDQC
jgi:prepilin-type N-terminal cleavage/methylation domain-containing protein